MILSYQSHKKIVIDQDGIYFLRTNSPIVFKDLVQGFSNRGKLVECVSDSYDGLEIYKEFDFIGDVLLSGDVTENYTRDIVKNLIENIDESNRNKIISAFYTLETILQDTLLLEDLPLEISFDEDLKKLLKMEQLHLDYSLMNDPYAIIETILKIHSICKIYKMPVFCNVSHYLETEQFKELSQLAKDLRQKVILIEFTEKNFKVVSENVYSYYIDQDFVDWY